MAIFLGAGRTHESLLFGINSNELDVLDVGFYHTVDGIGPASADANDLYLNVAIVILFVIDCHLCILLNLNRHCFYYIYMKISFARIYTNNDNIFRLTMQ